MFCMRTNKDLLVKGLRLLGYTVLLMFLAPFTIHQAFKNQEHPLYLPVLIFGMILALGAILLGFYGIKTIVHSMFYPKKK